MFHNISNPEWFGNWSRLEDDYLGNGGTDIADNFTFSKMEKTGGLFGSIIRLATAFPACIERTEQKSIAHQAAISEGKRSLIDFLASHVGENPTRNDMRSASKLSFEVIREIIDTLKDNQILDMDAKRFIVSFDSERADALLFPKD